MVSDSPGVFCKQGVRGSSPLSSTQRSEAYCGSEASVGANRGARLCCSSGLPLARSGRRVPRFPGCICFRACWRRYGLDDRFTFGVGQPSRPPRRLAKPRGSLTRAGVPGCPRGRQVNHLAGGAVSADMGSLSVMGRLVSCQEVLDEEPPARGRQRSATAGYACLPPSAYRQQPRLGRVARAVKGRSRITGRRT
jgi:hypothetical protein